MKKVLIVLFCAAGGTAGAQINQQTGTFIRGEKFRKEITTVSNSVLSRGPKTFDINSYSDVTNSYTVSDVSNDSYTFIVSRDQVIDSINAFGQQVNYNSDDAANENSVIAKDLKTITKTPATLFTNKNGIILSVAGDSGSHINNVLLAFTDLKPQAFTQGEELGLKANFIAALYKSGYSWTDSSLVNNRKAITTYTVASVNDTTTTITFATAVTESYLNTNINGVLLMNNQSGMIYSKMMRSAVNGYEIINGNVYRTVRRKAVTEVCYQVQ